MIAFTVEDLTDLIAILEQRPEWRERLRQILLTKGLLELPQLVDRISPAVDLLVQEVEENRWWQREVIEWQREVTKWMVEMNRWRDRADNDLAYLKGSDRERYCRDKSPRFVQWDSEKWSQPNCRSN